MNVRDREKERERERKREMMMNKIKRKLIGKLRRKNVIIKMSY